MVWRLAIHRADPSAVRKRAKTGAGSGEQVLHRSKAGHGSSAGEPHVLFKALMIHPTAKERR